MYALMPWIAVIVTALAGWALIKRYSTHMVLLFAGLAILLCAVVLGDPNFLPKGVKPSGFVLFDIFNTLKSIATKQSAGDYDGRRLCSLYGPHRRRQSLG